MFGKYKITDYIICIITLHKFSGRLLAAERTCRNFIRYL